MFTIMDYVIIIIFSYVLCYWALLIQSVLYNNVGVILSLAPRRERVWYHTVTPIHECCLDHISCSMSLTSSIYLAMCATGLVCSYRQIKLKVVYIIKFDACRYNIMLSIRHKSLMYPIHIRK